MHGLIARILYNLRKPKYCKYCSGPLVKDLSHFYSERTGKPIKLWVGVRCDYWYACHEEHGYYYQWTEKI